MTRTRAYLAQRARLRRLVAKRVAEQNVLARRIRVGEMLDRVRVIVTDTAFIAIAAGQGVKTAPTRLCEEGSTVSTSVSVQDFADNALKFVVAWKFLFPMIADPAIASFIERRWPGFIGDFKDTFISLVMHGPFPYERRPHIKPTFFS
ncbi:MAG: hypothetical protein ACTHM2_10130 [Afipia sp.]